MIIGFQGIKNSYNDYATDEFIKRLKINIKKLPLTTSECVARSLLNKEIDFGVIALKNNIAGIVEESSKILRSNLFRIVDTTEMEISHCLFELDIIIEKEKKFTKEFSKDKFGEYLDLSFETLAYEGMKIEQAIKVTIEVLKDIQKLVAV